MNKTKIFLILIVLFLAVGGVYYYFQMQKVNYLILGVPHNGIQNLFFQNANAPIIAPVMDILGYWGDERFSLDNLKQWLPVSATSSLPATMISFFKQNGYEIDLQIINKTGDGINQVKKFVNPTKKIPVIVFQKRSLDQTSSAASARVAIGVFDNEKKIIVHDIALGNNYEISYSDFENMFSDKAMSVLAVWPSEELKKVIKGPDYNTAYPLRTENMDKLGALLLKLADVSFYSSAGDFEKEVSVYREIIDNENFKYFPLAFQISILSRSARAYIRIHQYNEAISIINNRVLPLNKNLNESFEGWFISDIDESSYPYFVLSLAYLRNGQKVLAIENYRKMLSIRDSIRKKLSNVYIGPII